MEYGEVLNRIHILRPVVVWLPGTCEGLRGVGTEPGGYAWVRGSVAPFLTQFINFLH